MLGDLMVRFSHLLVDQGIRLRQLASALGTPPANHVAFYCIDDSGVPRLFYKDDAGNVYGPLGSGAVAVEDEGVSEVAAATTLNFEGAGVTVVDAGGGEATVTIPGGGGGVAVQLSKSAAQEMTNNMVEVVTFNGTNFDDDTLFVDGDDTITIETAGVYLVVASVQWEANSTGLRAIFIQTDSTGSFADVAGVAISATPFAGTIPQQTLAIVELDVGDKIRLTAFQSSGGGLDINGVADTTLSATLQG